MSKNRAEREHQSLTTSIVRQKLRDFSAEDWDLLNEEAMSEQDGV